MTSIYVALMFLAYKFIPNTKVEAKYAIRSAIACGIALAIVQHFGFMFMGLFSSYRNIYGDLASLMIFLLLIYFTWTVCLAGSKWNYFLQKADEQERENDYKNVNHIYHKFLCLLVIERIESIYPFSSRFSAAALAQNAESEYGLPEHLTIDILEYLRNKKIVFSGRGDTLYMSKRYCGRTVRQLVADLDVAGRNGDVIMTLKDIHGNSGLNHLWKLVNGEAVDADGAVLDTPVRDILGIKA